MLGDEQGQLLSLLGSDSPFLKRGRDALHEVATKHAKHPLATYARLALGVNDARDFKQITPDKQIVVRSANTADAVAHLEAVEQASSGDAGVDNITLNYVMRTRARAEAKTDIKAAKATLDSMPKVFKARGLKPEIVDRVAEQAAATKAELKE
jgi:hypothetical protein